MRVRLLPWRPRWRKQEWADGPDSSGLDLGDDFGVGLVILVALLFLPITLGLIVLSAEILLLLGVLPVLMTGQFLGLLPWVLVLRYDGGKRYVEVTGMRSMLAARRQYRAGLA